MKQLFLVRHAKATEQIFGIEDFDRPLTERGIKNAHLMGNTLNQQRIKPQLIISSPATRAISTAIILSRELNFPVSKIILEEKLYESSLNNYYQILKKTDDSIQTLFLIAHNPTITEMCNLLNDTFIDVIPTAGVVGLSFNMDSWKNVNTNKATLILFDYPKKP